MAARRWEEASHERSTLPFAPLDPVVQAALLAQPDQAWAETVRLDADGRLRHPPHPQSRIWWLPAAWTAGPPDQLLARLPQLVALAEAAQAAGAALVTAVAPSASLDEAEAAADLLWCVLSVAGVAGLAPAQPLADATAAVPDTLFP